MTESVVSASINSLIGDHLVRMAPSRPPRPVAVAPETCMGDLLARAEDDIERQRQRLATTRLAFAALLSYRDTERGGDIGFHVRGVDQVRMRITQLASWAREDLLILSPDDSSTPASVGLEAGRAAARRGLTVRTIHHHKVRSDAQAMTLLQSLTCAGVQLATVPEVPQLMLVVDGEVALVPAGLPDEPTGALELRAPGAVALALALFEWVWSVGLPVDNPDDVTRSSVTPFERAMLQLLAEGHTDESTARRLLCSVRTVRRSMAALMHRLGARSRFQAGTRAAEMGWLPRTGLRSASADLEETAAPGREVAA
ncbi:DNA-binding response regulator [Micromonospora arida]|uniref:DNA-binding response regulator n=2 Tax=Micromonospora arida TaxID=2203715 RepID=A0A3N9WT29_9ACTN|nr:DNA-binding response regulator [Micromonospora arida]